MKRFFNIVFWIALIAYLFVTVSFVSGRRQEQVCTSVKITVVDSVRSRFVTVSDIDKMIDTRNLKLSGKRFDSINTWKLGEFLNTYAPVGRADVYKTINGTVHVDIKQRSPLLRVINRYGESFYLDEQGEALRHTSQYCAHVMVANGYISQQAPGQKSFNVLDIKPEPGTRSIIRELFELAKYIDDDKFWKAQIQQIYVNGDGDFELIPRVGAHVIVFGRFENQDKKFSNLKAFYQNGLNVEGWNKYDIINLKYSGQIVATKR